MSEAKPMTPQTRMDNYQRQNGNRAFLTANQWRSMHRGFRQRAAWLNRQKKEQA